nr:MBL fold metallo-hydrolase [Candidatus Microthrix sp.]
MSDATATSTATPGSSRLYFRQLLAGRDFAKNDPIARQMVNFVYAIGDRQTGEAVLVDPAYAPGELVDVLEADDMMLTGALVTHYHPDHSGGDMMGHNIAGVRELLERVEVPLHIQGDEVEWLRKVTEVSDDQLHTHTSGDVVMVGEVPITLIHTLVTHPAASAFWWKASWWRATHCFGGLWPNRPARRRPGGAVREPDATTVKKFPTTPRCTQATCTRPSHRHRWAIPARTTSFHAPQCHRMDGHVRTIGIIRRWRATGRTSPTVEECLPATCWSRVSG